MTLQLHCVGCGERIKGGIVMVLELDAIVTKGITEPGPHCNGCYTTACDEFSDKHGVKT